ncbi:Flagellar motor protein [Neofusicoccum parvum]|uniref:Uncharacterized protein n=2 Tax=Neofusicoccum parvum TaxID=310453 RepID=R1FYW8_BOTPV|nr:hypothetical protein UCRNP2_8918 [Neofusicoccum parvum UCRNP2]GME28739.1 Flagellar motor protein [Neofusicoccum parvum]GME44080.1 Flagellar motor protein [Neofusicoccum parvum]
MAASDKTPGLAHFPKPPRSSFKPTCTHVTMVRAYGATCQNCNRKSPLGWVWQCACDEGDDPWTIIATHQSAAAACDPADPISKMKALTLNQSVIDQAESGLYTPEQIERLISQKQQVMHVINSQSPDKAAEGDVRPSTRKPSFLANARSFESFDAVFGGEVKPLRPADVANLPVQDAKVMSNIGMSNVDMSSTAMSNTGMSPPLLMTKSSFSTDSGDSEPAESVRTWKTTDSALDFRNRETMQARTFYRVEPMNDMDYMYHNLNDYSFGRNFRSSMSHAVNISDADGGVSLTEESAELHKPDLVPQGIMAQA